MPFSHIAERTGAARQHADGGRSSNAVVSKPPGPAGLAGVTPGWLPVGWNAQPASGAHNQQIWVRTMPSRAGGEVVANKAGAGVRDGTGQADIEYGRRQVLHLSWLRDPATSSMCTLTPAQKAGCMAVLRRCQLSRQANHDADATRVRVQQFKGADAVKRLLSQAQQGYSSAAGAEWISIPALGRCRPRAKGNPPA